MTPPAVDLRSPAATVRGRVGGRWGSWWMWIRCVPRGAPSSPLFGRRASRGDCARSSRLLGGRRGPSRASATGRPSCPGWRSWGARTWRRRSRSSSGPMPCAGGPRGVAWAPRALARRIPNLLCRHAFFAAELRADPAQRRAVLESLQAQAAALAGAVAGQPADHRLIAAGRALFMAGRFFDGMEARGWPEAGAAILWAPLRRQVDEDG